MCNIYYLLFLLIKKNLHISKTITFLTFKIRYRLQDILANHCSIYSINRSQPSPTFCNIRWLKEYFQFFSQLKIYTRGEREQHLPTPLKLFPVKFYWLGIKALLHANGQTTITDDIWNFLQCVCACLCVYLIKPTAEDSSLANCTEFSPLLPNTPPLPSLLPLSFPNLPNKYIHLHIA